MSKQQQINYLMERYALTFEVAYEKLSVNGWNLIMAAGEIRDELS